MRPSPAHGTTPTDARKGPGFTRLMVGMARRRLSPPYSADLAVQAIAVALPPQRVFNPYSSPCKFFPGRPRRDDAGADRWLCAKPFLYPSNCC